MKKLMCLFLVIVSQLLIVDAFAEDVIKLQDLKQHEKELPHYFPEGMITTQDPLKQRQEALRFLYATNDKFQVDRFKYRGPIIVHPDSIVVETDIDSTSSLVDKEPVKMRLHLDNYVQMSDGKIRVTNFTEQYFITRHQLEVVVYDMIAITKEASHNDWLYYKNLTEVATKARTGQLGITVEELVAQLDEQDPDHPGVTFRDLHKLPPATRESDFAPKNLHLGYNPELDGILGACWLNTGLVYYNPQARLLDYLMSKPCILQHEMMHCNHRFQRYPFTAGFDAELFASVPEMLYEENKTDVFYHGYAKDIREMIWVFTGFNFKQARKEIFKFNRAGDLEVDIQKYQEYFAKLEAAKKVVSEIFQIKAIPLFYSDVTYWSAFHDKMQDDSAVLRLAMAGELDMTILSGRRETMLWLEARKERILEMAKKAYAKSGEKDKNSGFDTFRAPQFWVDEYRRSFSHEEREQLEAYFQNRPEELERLKEMASSMKWKDAAALVKTILNRKKGVFLQ